MLGSGGMPPNLRLLPSPMLIIGPAHCGKSDFAVEALNQSLRAAFVGTADISEPGMTALVAPRRAVRPEFWDTLEDVNDLPRLLAEVSQNYPQVLVDSINQWIARVFVKESAKHAVEDIEKIVETDAEQICAVLAGTPKSRIVLVTSEVAAGLAPPSASARAFRQTSGRINCRLAAACRSVVLITAGIPMVIKGEPLELA
jgi:adenosylcobinamide kinase/adenosylcobinamide-phosphate guanylyltransferase